MIEIILILFCAVLFISGADIKKLKDFTDKSDKF